MAEASVAITFGRARSWRNLVGGLACLCALWACAGDGEEADDRMQRRAAMRAERESMPQLNRAACDSIMRVASAPPAAGQGAAPERDSSFLAALEWCERRMAEREGGSQEGRAGEGREGRPGADAGQDAERAQRKDERSEATARFAEQVPRARQELASVVPAGATLILVDQSTLPADFASGRRSLPFLERGGEYWGLPADDETAVRELERLRREHQARYIVFAWPAFWWLDHYAGFAAHLRNSFRPVLNNERLIVFELTP